MNNNFQVKFSAGDVSLVDLVETLARKLFCSKTLKVQSPIFQNGLMNSLPLVYDIAITEIPDPFIRRARYCEPELNPKLRSAPVCLLFAPAVSAFVVRAHPTPLHTTRLQPQLDVAAHMSHSREAHLKFCSPRIISAPRLLSPSGPHNSVCCANWLSVGALHRALCDWPRRRRGVVMTGYADS